jgi:hypothetical protein
MSTHDVHTYWEVIQLIILCVTSALLSSLSAHRGFMISKEPTIAPNVQN